MSEEGTDHRIDSSRETDADIDTDNHEYIIYTQNDQKVYNEVTK